LVETVSHVWFSAGREHVRWQFEERDLTLPDPARIVSGGRWVEKLTVDQFTVRQASSAKTSASPCFNSNSRSVAFTDAGRATIRAPISTWEAGWCV
jgi:hypothetical protein